MATANGKWVAVSVKATSVSDGQVHVFPSLLAARRMLKDACGKQVDHSMIKRRAERGEEAHGYKWELVVPEAPVAASVGDEAVDVDAPKFTFRECVEAIFNGGQVRVTDENPRRVSVFDLITIVADSKNPHMVYQRLCAENAEVITYCENLMFPGAGQRDTPVCNAEGAMYIVNLLPGKRAVLFRKSAIHTLTRFLAGDATLHEELDANAARQAELAEKEMAGKHAMVAYSNPQYARFLFQAPSMAGKYVNMFYNRQVVYLLVWQHDGDAYIKVGWSDNFGQRMRDIALPGFKIWCVYATQEARRVELAFKQDFAAWNKVMKLGGSTQTELFTGVCIEECEERLVQLVEEHGACDAWQKQRATWEHERKMKELENSLELKRLELQILQAQLALKSVA